MEGLDRSETLGKIRHMDRRLVDHFVRRELVSRSQMQRVILRATRDKRGLVAQILEDPSVDEVQLARELASFHGVGFVERSAFHVHETALKFLPKEMADKHGVLPYGLSAREDKVSVAVVDPDEALEVLGTLKTATGTAPSVFVAPSSWLRGAIRHFYFGDEWADGQEQEEGESDEELAMNGSAELVLDEVVEPGPNGELPRSGARSRSSAGAAGAAAAAVAAVAAVAPKDPMVAALDDFDSFLDTSKSPMQSSPGSKVAPPALEDLEASPMHEVSLGSGWSSFDDGEDDSFGSGFAVAPLSGSTEARAGFDLFDEKSEVVDRKMTLPQIVERQEKTIQRLLQDMQQQREIIQALVDMLGEARVLNKRDLKKRIRKK